MRPDTLLKQVLKVFSHYEPFTARTFASRDSLFPEPVKVSRMGLSLGLVFPRWWMGGGPARPHLLSLSLPELCIRMHISKKMCYAYIPTYIHTYMHAYAHARTHTHTCARAYTLLSYYNIIIFSCNTLLKTLSQNGLIVYFRFLWYSWEHNTKSLHKNWWKFKSVWIFFLTLA